MPYYPALNLIFIHIPKTAGGSIEHALQGWKAPGQKTVARRVMARLGLRQDGMRAYVPGHATARWHRRVLGAAVFDAATRFAVVRDPYARAISAYEFIRQNPRHHRHRQTVGQGFEQFLQAGRGLSQMPFLTGRGGVLLVEHLVRFERLHDDLAALAAQTGLPLVLPQGGRRNGSDKREAGHYLTDAAVRIINRACAEDFRRLGYPMRDAGR